MQLADEQKLACVKQGLYTFREAGQPLALLLSEEDTYRSDKGLDVAVMAPDRETAERFGRIRQGSAFTTRALASVLVSVRLDRVCRSNRPTSSYWRAFNRLRKNAHSG